MDDGRKPIALRWEMLVFAYNLLPLIGGLWVLDALFEVPFPLIQVVMLLALIAHACYCFGPLLRIAVALEAGEEARAPGRKAVVLWWERRRFAYNLILLLEGLVVLRQHFFSLVSRFWVLTLMFAIVVNVGYSLGPLIEMRFQSFLKRPLGRARHLLFWVGLLLSMGWAWMWALRGLGKL